MNKTKITGVYYRELKTNDKDDKTFYITYKDTTTNKKVWLKIGKYSEGVREAYCNQKRNEILTKQRNGEEPPAIASKKKKDILSIVTVADDYFSLRKDGNSKLTDKSHFTHYILPYFRNLDFENITKDEIQKFTFELKKTKSVLKKVLLAAPADSFGHPARSIRTV